MHEKDSCAGNRYQIMNKLFSSLELVNIVAKILNQRQNIHQREKDADEEKSNLVPLLGEMNNLSVEEDSRTSMKNFLTNSGEKGRTQENIVRSVAKYTTRSASWWATFTFSLCLLSFKLSKPLLQPQGSHSLWLAIVGMFSFTLFVSAVSVMLVVGACFTQMQITIMLIAFLAMVLA